MALQRAHGRNADQLRPLKITHNAFGYAAASILFELGNTKVLCNVTLQAGVPQFLKGKREGWLTAEYGLLPTSTHSRLHREAVTIKRNDRAIEISRMIGRSLRTIVDLSRLGERTIMVDCDVLQADGSTRTAAITGSYLALNHAQEVWLRRGELSDRILIDDIAAVSVGWSDGIALLDLDYQEDSTLDADYNVVLTGSGNIIEIQGTAEKKALSWHAFDAMMTCARSGVVTLFGHMESHLKHFAEKEPVSSSEKNNAKVPLFSLQSRLAAATSERL